MKRFTILGTILTLVLLAISVTVVPSDVSAQDAVTCESDVVVQADDWLSKLADKFYGDVLAYPSIAQATNAVAATDDSYATIANADLIEVGWKLCIPSADDAQAMMSGSMADASGEAMASSDTVKAAVEESMALPGEGITVRQGRPTWDTEWFQAELLKALLEELGYTVEGPDTLDNAAFFSSAARGDMDFWASGWFPLHNTFMEDENVAGKAVIVGNMAPNGGLMGYLIDKKTADEHGITNLGDLADPEMAALFDVDGDGMADLMGCDPGWGCESIINHHLEAYELSETVMHVQGSYSALLADTHARLQREEPVLFLTWTPNWTVGLMKPGTDVVWIETPFYTAPDDQQADDSTGTAEGVVGCVSDPCQLGVAPADIQIVANKEFVEANPAANSLFEQVQFELADIFEQNARMFNGEDSDEDLARHADEWIEANRDTVDGWIANAIAAAK